MKETVLEINWKKNLIYVWLTQILAMAGYSAITPFIPLFIKEKYNIHDEKTLGVWVSLITFFGFFSFCLSAPLWGVLADKYGRKLMLLRSYFVTGLLFPLLFFAPSIYWLIAIRFAVSAFSGTATAAQTLIVTTTPPEHHGVALGTFSTSIWSGNMIGFLCGAFFVNCFGYFWGFCACGAMYLLSGFITLFLVKENFVPQPEKEKKEKQSFWVGLKGLSWGIWGIFLLFVLMGIARRFDEPFIPILVEQISGQDTAVFYTGIISMIAALGGLFSGILMGKLCDRFSPFAVAVPAILLSALTMVFQAFAAGLLVLGGARFLHFTAAGGLEPAFQSLLSRLSPEEKRGTLFGIASSMRMIGILIASLLSGGVIYLFGIRAVFLGTGVLFLLLLPLLWFTKKNIKS